MRQPCAPAVIPRMPGTRYSRLIEITPDPATRSAPGRVFSSETWHDSTPPSTIKLSDRSQKPLAFWPTASSTDFDKPLGAARGLANDRRGPSVVVKAVAARSRSPINRLPPRQVFAGEKRRV